MLFTTFPIVQDWVNAYLHRISLDLSGLNYYQASSFSFPESPMNNSLNPRLGEVV